MIETLSQLISCLYPDPPPPGLLVLGGDSPPIPSTRTAQAVAAVTNAQRLNRGRDYVLSGLCEFHIGIIYAYWDDFLGAGQQFILARRQWRFSNQQTAVCLTHFAEGYAQEAAFAYESALTAYRYAEQCLPAWSDNCLDNLQDALAARKAHAHEQLFSALTAAPSSSQQHAVPAPISQINAAPSAHERTSTNDTPPPVPMDVPPPLFNLSKRPLAASPIPNHSNNGYHQWYRVHHLNEHNLFPHIKADTYLLIDTTRADTYKEDEFLLIKNGQEGDGVTLRPYPPPQTPFERIYLTEVVQAGRFVRDMFNGTVRFSSIRQKNNIHKPDIIGLVIGIWHSGVGRNSEGAE